MIAPLVDPADPPKSIAKTRIISANAGQPMKSTLAYPVVVIIETTWKVAPLIASSPSARPSFQRSAARTAASSARVTR